MHHTIQKETEHTPNRMATNGARVRLGARVRGCARNARGGGVERRRGLLVAIIHIQPYKK